MGIRQILHLEQRIWRENFGDGIRCENMAFFLENICKKKNTPRAHIRRNENIEPYDSNITKIIFDRFATNRRVMLDGCTAEQAEHCKIELQHRLCFFDIIYSFDIQTCFRERFV